MSNKVDWTSDLTLELIILYETYPCLFDTKNKFYSNKHARNDALVKITQQLKTLNEKIEVEDVKKKINNLRSQFSHEHNKVLASGKSGDGTDDGYEPSVWWYEKLLFLTAYIKPRKSQSSLNSLSQSQTQQIDLHNNESQLDSQEDSLLEYVHDDNTNSSVVDSQSYLESTSQTTPTTSSLNKKRKVNESTTSDPIIGKTVEALNILGKRLKAPPTASITSKKSDIRIFSDYVESELQDIEDPELVNDAKHSIHNILYDTRKKWLAKKTSNNNVMFVVTDTNI